jgi:hypothetical protein
MDTPSPSERTHSEPQASVEERLAQLERLLQHQQGEIADQRAHIAQLEAERGSPAEQVVDGASIMPTEEDSPAAGRHAGSKRSRRALLKLGGAAAASVAATAALVASEGGQTAHAADNDPLTIGQANLGTSQTSLAITGTSSVSPFFVVDASASTHISPNAIRGIADVAMGTGVVGESNGASGAGVGGAANGAGGIGVGGTATGANGIGVYATSTSGYGLTASSGFVDMYANGTGRLLQKPQSSTGAPISGTYSTGEQIRDSAGALWLCIAGGTPGTWQQAVATPSSSTVTLQLSALGPGHAAIEGDGTSNAVGVLGTSDHASGVAGTSGDGSGVSGTATAVGGYGVYGHNDAGSGVVGQSGNGIGVLGKSSNGVAVEGFSVNGYGAMLEGGLAPLILHPTGFAGAPATGTHQVGELYVDSGGILWYCTGNGTPGSWARVALVPNGAHGGTITYLSSPIRLLDARTSPGTAVVTRAPLGGNETYAFTVAGLGGSGIPASAQGLIANVTVLGPSGAGNLSLFPAPGPGPSVASMTFGTPGLFLANGVNVAIGTAGQIMIQNQSGGTTPLVLDAVAYVS